MQRHLFCAFYGLSMVTFRIFKIPVSVHPWFWVTLALIGGGLGANSSYAVLMVILFVLAGFISVLVHELGHALIVRKYGLPTEVHLVAFGGFATFPQGHLSRKQSFLVTAAGPCVQFMLGVLCLVLLVGVPMPAESLLRKMIQYLTGVSFVWSLLNCLPIFPMDGGQMLAALLGPQRRRLTYLTGMFTAIAIGLLGYFLLNALLLALFMGFFAYQNWQQYSATPRPSR